NLASASTTSTTSIPSGKAASSRRRTSSGSQSRVTANSRYSASLADPVGAPPEYEILGCGENPAEYATGRPALRTPRSIARATSRWLAKRILPLLAYLIVSRWTVGAGGGPAGAGLAISRRSPGEHRQRRPRPASDQGRRAAAAWPRSDPFRSGCPSPDRLRIRS